MAFLLVAAAALGSILSFALTSHRRESQTRPGTLVQAPAVNGVCPAALKVRRGADAPTELCPVQCAPAADDPGSCSCEILVDRCRAAP